MRYRWQLPDTDPKAQDIVCDLAQTLNVPESIAQILVARGITTFDEARDYFRPSLERLHPPELMHDMEPAQKRIISAINKGENIVVFGDYDVDGTTSTAMMSLYLKSVGAKITYHIPDRFTEGYGLTIQSLERVFSVTPDVTVLIAIDCGITAVEAVAYAASKGVDVIICDHHEPGSVLPQAYATLNPLHPECRYPFKQLCGCGVAFKLIQRIAAALGTPETAYEYLDFVAMASSADIVSLSGENRILVHFGLRQLNENPRPGIKALIETAGLKPGKITTTQLVFGIAPRINAAGRIGDGARAVELLMAQSEDDSMRAAKVLDEENFHRRRYDEEAFYEACEIVEATLNRHNDRIIVVHNESWHAGVIGIVASRLVERYHLPVVLMTTVDGIAKGSARSIHGFDIHSALKRCEHMLVTYGGHKYAAGVSIAIDRLQEFRLAMNTVASELITKEMLSPMINIDAVINLNELTPKYFAIIRQLAPFGPDNHRPVFYSDSAQIVGYPRAVGKSNDHLKCNIRSRERLFIDKQTRSQTPANTIPFTADGAPIDAIGFGMGHRIDELYDGQALRDNLEIVYYLDENDFQQKITPQLVLRDFR